MPNNENIKRVELKNTHKKMNPKLTAFIMVVSIIVLAGIMLCVNFGVFGGAFMGANTPASVAKTFVNALVKGQANGILNCYPDFVYSDRARELEYLVDAVKSECYDDVEIILGDVVELSDTEIEFIRASWTMYYYYDESALNDITDFATVKFTVGYTYYDEQDYVSGEMLLVKYKGYWKILTPNVLDEFEVVRNMIHHQ